VNGKQKETIVYLKSKEEVNDSHNKHGSIFQETIITCDDSKTINNKSLEFNEPIKEYIRFLLMKRMNQYIEELKKEKEVEIPHYFDI